MNTSKSNVICFHHDTFVIDGLLVFLVTKDALFFIKILKIIFIHSCSHSFHCGKLFFMSEKNIYIYRLSNDVYKILPEILNKKYPMYTTL